LCIAESPVTVAVLAVTTSLFTGIECCSLATPGLELLLYLLDINRKYEIHCREHSQ